MSEGFVGGLVQGFLSRVAPAYFDAMKEQEFYDTKRNNMLSAIKQREQNNLKLEEQLKNINNPSIRNILMARSTIPIDELNADQAGEIDKELLKAQYDAYAPTDKIKEANYVFDASMPLQNTEMVRQRAMSERPADFQERQIKQQNADTLSRNSGIAKQNADTNQLYRKNQVENPTIPKLGGNKQLASDSKVEYGKQQLNSLLDETKFQIDSLNKLGALSSPKKDILDNTLSAIKNSTGGQIVGRITGTQEQTLRDNIKNLKPRILNGIMAATGMSAKQLDSNVELQTMMDSLGSMGQSVESQLEIIDNLQKTYLDSNKSMVDAEPISQDYKYSDSGKERYDPVKKTVESKVGNKWVKIYENAILNDDGSISSDDKLDEEVKPDVEEDLNIDDLVNKYKTKSK